MTELTKEKRIEQLLAKSLIGVLFLAKLRTWSNPLGDEISKALVDAIMASLMMTGKLAGVEPERLAEAYDKSVADVIAITDKLVSGTGSIEELLRQMSSQVQH